MNVYFSFRNGEQASMTHVRDDVANAALQDFVKAKPVISVSSEMGVSVAIASDTIKDIKVFPEEC